jgi:transglutaminase-like putative cysteine protease
LNLLLTHGSEKEINELVSDGIFGTTLYLWTGQRSWFRVEYTFEPAPLTKKEDGEVTQFTFQDPPRVHGIPYVDVHATIRVKNAYQPSGDRPSMDLLRATPRWPKEPVQESVVKLKSTATTSREKLDSILAYISSEIRFDGPITGSRYGVAEVLKQKFGHCWDKSDLFVTMCRSAGLPARQIAGWVPALQSGHVWAEVYLDGAGWLPVDPTTPWTGTSDDYIPWFSTSDGEMPMLYLAIPEIRHEK